jgi:hypothetical protein
MRKLRLKSTLSRYGMKFNPFGWISNRKNHHFTSIFSPKASTSARLTGGLDLPPQTGKTTARQCFNRGGCDRVYRPGFENNRLSIDIDSKIKNIKRKGGFTIPLRTHKTLLGGRLVTLLRIKQNF